MLSHVAKHGSNLIKIEAKGDIEIDFHHTVEDIGIVFGRAIKEALGDKKGINRYGYASIPMDETLADVSLDICDRSVFVYNVTFKNSKIGDFDTELVKEFFAALSQSSGMTLHINVPYGENDHHIAEAVFKSFAKALKSAVSFSGDNTIPSTKGVL
jgi:imidazoleglycerol-phosphate dehydratase